MSGKSGPRFDEARGCWTARVDIGVRPDGKRRQKRVSARTKREWHEKAARLRVDVADRTYVSPSKRTVAAYLEEWLQTLTGPKPKASTADTYRRALSRHVMPRIGGLRLDHLDVVHLDRLYRDLTASGLAPATVRNQVHAPLRKALNDAVKKDYIRRNPALVATLPGAVKPAMKTWMGGELEAFLAAEEGSRYHALWTMLATTGCRRGEALGLRWGDMNLDEATATIRQQVTSIGHKIVIAEGTKTGKGRQVGLDARTVTVLRAHKASQAAERLALGPGYRDEDLCFAKVDGGPLHPEFVSRQFVRRCQALGLPRIRLHDLRHTWATLALEAGLDVKVVSNRLGHSSVLVTADIYTHVAPATDIAAAEKVADLIFGGSK